MKQGGYDMVQGGLLLALALAFPILFHALGLGSVFLPLLLPVAVAGFLTALPISLSVAVLAPLISALVTGMPPIYPPVAPVMMAEGAALAGTSALLYRRLGFNLWISLGTAILAERLILFAGTGIIGRLMALPAGILGPAAVLHSLPGIALMLVLVPPAVRVMERQKQKAALFQ